MAIQIESIIEDIMKEFEKKIAVKTGWGKNEIVNVMKESIAIALAKNLDAY